jgi:hypothetical protein
MVKENYLKKKVLELNSKRIEFIGPVFGKEKETFDVSQMHLYCLIK